MTMTTSKYKLIISVLLGFLIAISSCTEDLNVEPLDDDVVTPEDVYQDADSYRQVLAKLYAGLSLTGQEGPAGNPDIQGIDEGFSNYLRQYWVAQEIPTDEVVVAWSDPGLPAFNTQSWDASNDFIMALYSRIFYQITSCNEFIRESEDGKLNERGFSDSEKEKIRQFRAEARFLRAFSYWHAMDLYRNIPFITEDDEVGAFYPEQIDPVDLFDYLEKELQDIENELVDSKSNEYGRVDQAAAWTLLAKLYLNAEVYTGQKYYTEAITYAKKVIDESGYALEDNYEHLFLADNETADGIIFPITFDGRSSETYGGTNFIIHAAVGGDMDPDDYGVDGGWGGHRVTPEFVNLFPSDDSDQRKMFFTSGQTLEIDDVSDFRQGYAVEKFKNINRSGEPGKDLEFVDTDFPVFRLADVYLMYAEAVVRGGEGGSIGDAVDYVNEIRQRAYGDNSGDITNDDLDLEFILEERGRELYWEGHRRTDLVRYEFYTGGDYVWAWKGDSKDGSSTDSYLNIYPIPDSDINANPELEQNDNY